VIVINTNIPERFFAQHAGDKGIKAAREQYRAWLRIAEAARWQSPPQITRSHPKASILKGGRVVFNIKGNSYRLIANIDYLASVVEIRFFGTHGKYDKVDAETI
jgi:mRNA interferase HigB